MVATSQDSTSVEWAPVLLVIDDDENIHDLTDYYLTGVVSETIHASSGTEGIMVALRVRPDAILLDIDMPEMDGFAVCRELKENEATRDIPILFLTKDRETCHIVRALDFGGSDYVTKPFVPIELQARVRSALRVKRASDVLRQQAMFDPLTNLANRRAFDAGLKSSIDEYNLNGQPFSLLILDLDFFKSVNDTYGHGVGDEVLMIVGKELQRVCRPDDVAARYGGEEFGLVMNNTTLSDAASIGERLLNAIRALEISVNDHNLNVTASAGLASAASVDQQFGATEIIEYADEALYQAKKLGRDQLVLAK